MKKILHLLTFLVVTLVSYQFVCAQGVPFDNPDYTYTQLWESSEKMVRWPDFSATTNKIVWRDGDMNGYVADFNANTGALTNITSFGSGGDVYEAAFTADGNYIFYQDVSSTTSLVVTAGTVKAYRCYRYDITAGTSTLVFDISTIPVATIEALTSYIGDELGFYVGQGGSNDDMIMSVYATDGRMDIVNFEISTKTFSNLTNSSQGEYDGRYFGNDLSKLLYWTENSAPGERTVAILEGGSETIVATSSTPDQTYYTARWGADQNHIVAIKASSWAANDLYQFTYESGSWSAPEDLTGTGWSSLDGGIYPGPSTGNGFIFGVRSAGANNGLWFAQEIPTEVLVDDDYTTATPGWSYDHFATVQNGISKVAAEGTVNVADGTYELTSQMNIDKGISIVGLGTVIFQANNPAWSTTNGYKHLIGIYAGTLASPITISNITINCNSECYGLNTYSNAYGILNNVTINDSKGAGLTVNGSTIIATDLYTNDNAWGAVNVDPGSGVTDPSIFTLNSGTLAESNQIWSDGSYVTPTVTVTVNAVGYDEYIIGDGAHIGTHYWTNRELTNCASITINGETTTYSTIQLAIDDATAGDIIQVAPGTYNENIEVNKLVSINGAGSGSDPASNTIITQNTTGAGDTKIGVVQLSASGLSKSNPILFQDFRIEPEGMAGFSVGRFTEATGTSVSYIKIDNVKVIGTNTSPSTEQERGLYVDLTSTLKHLDIDNSAFDNLTYGWYTQKEVSADASTVQYVTVNNTTFNHNNHKGIYVEKLSDATFTECTADQNGFDSSILPSYFQAWSAGIDVNTKAGTYNNFTFENCTITNNAIDEAKEGVGLTVKARDDGSYTGFPASVDNVIIRNCTVTGNERGIRIGEPGKDNATPTNVLVEYCTISGNVQHYSGSDGSEYGGLINCTSTSKATVDATNNWWGDASGPFHLNQNPTGSGDAVSDNVDFTPFLTDSPFPVTNIEEPVLATGSSCGNYDVDITVQDFNNVGAISLALNYDINQLEYIDITPNTAISNIVLTEYTAGQLRMSWFGNTGVTLDDDDMLLTLNFDLLPSESEITTDFSWSTATGDCEYAAPGLNGITYASTFNDLSWTIPVRPVLNTTTLLEYCKIQDAIDDALTVNGHTITVAAGTYTEDVVIDKELTLLGANADVSPNGGSRGAESIIQPISNGASPISLGAGYDHVTINGFEITGTLSEKGIYCGVYGPSYLDIKFNYIHHIGTDRGSQNVHAISYRGGPDDETNINISDNYFNEILNTDVSTNGKGSSAAIWFGQSNGEGTITNVTIEKNVINNVYSNLDTKTFENPPYGDVGKITASAIYFGIGWKSDIYNGNIDGAIISENTITNVIGGMAYAIQLSGSTPNIDISNNTIDNISSPNAPSYAYGVAVPSTNTGTGILVNENSFTNTLYAITNGTASVIDATCNWWGSGNDAYDIDDMITGDVSFLSFLEVDNTTGTSYWWDAVNDYSCTGVGPILVYEGATANVRSSHMTIQDAIDDANTQTGDRVWLAGGTYPQTASTSYSGVQVDFDGEIDGSGNPLATIKGNLYLDNADGRYISNLRFEVDASELLTLINTNDLYISNCIFDGNIISGNNGEFLNGKNGINHVSGPNGNSDVTVEDCIFQNGLYVGINSRITNLTVENTEFTNVKSAINQMGGNNLVVTDCKLSVEAQANTSDTYGIRFASDVTEDLTVSNCKFIVDDNGFTAIGGDYHAAMIIRASATGTITAHGSAIFGDIVNLSSTIMDATCNWWGTGNDAYDIDDMISGDVLFLSYLEVDNSTGTSYWWDAVDDYSCTGIGPVTVWDATHTTNLSSHMTIQNGINAAIIGEIVDVAVGIYPETVTIEKSLTLNGAQAGVDPRAGGRTEGDALTETIITGELGTRDLGVYILGEDGAHVTDIVIDGIEITEANYANVQIDYADNCTLKNTFVSGCITNEGIKTKAACDGLLFQMVISHDNHGDGIELGDYGTHTNHMIEDSWFYNNDDRGVHLAETDGITVQRVKCYGNQGTTGNYHQGGIITYQSFNTTLIDVECYDNVGFGINFYKENYDEAVGGSSSSVSGASKTYNNLGSSYGAGDGIRAYLSNNISITELESYDNIRQGIRITSEGYVGEPCENIDITNCDVYNNGASAIVFKGDDVKNCVANNNSLISAITSTDPVIINTTLETIDATCNWWGTANGDLIAPMISGDVAYIYWLSDGTDIGDPGFVPGGTCTGAPNLTGTINYYNSGLTSLSDVTVELWKDNAKVYPVTGTVITDGSGNYTFTNVLPDTYGVKAITTEDVGGINSTDAAQVNYWGVYYSDIQLVRFHAGDVNNNLAIQANDAGKIQEYFLTLGNPDPAFATAWSFWNKDELTEFIVGPPDEIVIPTGLPTVTVPNIASTVAHDMFALVTGDFNRSFIPGSKDVASETLTLNYGDVLEVGADEFELPLYAGIDMKVGAVSLILNVPSDMVEVHNVYLGTNPDEPVLYSVEGDELRISWLSLNSVNLQEGDVMLTMVMNVVGETAEDGLQLSLAADPLNELANATFDVINNAVLVVDVVHTTFTGVDQSLANGQLELSSHPNPFKQTTTFVYTLPGNGKVSLEVYDILGNKVKTVVNEMQNVGEHQIKFDANTLQPGVYTALLRVENTESVLTRTIKIISK